MGLDIRLPMGLFFTLAGLALTLFGLLGDQEIYRRSLGLNVNLVWGLVLMAIAFVPALWMALGSRRDRRDATRLAAEGVAPAVE